VSVEKLSGTYTYRSFLDRPEPVDDFDRLRFAQLELRVSVDTGGALSGELVFPASAGTAPLAMDVGGTVADRRSRRSDTRGKDDQTPRSRIPL
jgi:hypothetical protein